MISNKQIVLNDKFHHLIKRVKVGVLLAVILVLLIILASFASPLTWVITNNQLPTTTSKITSGFLAFIIIALSSFTSYESYLIINNGKRITRGSFKKFLGLNLLFNSWLIVLTYFFTNYLLGANNNLWTQKPFFYFLLLVINMGLILLLYPLWLVVYLKVSQCHFNQVQKKSFFILNFSALFFWFGIYYLLQISSYTVFIYLLLIGIISDTGAYLAGSLWGKKQLAPNISPNKTVLGTVFGVISVFFFFIIFVLFAWFSKENFSPFWTGFFHLFQLIKDRNSSFYVLSLTLLFCVTIIFTIAAIVGDLYFSWLKRNLAIKDFSQLLSAHGGVYDRIDSHLLVVGIFLLVDIWISLIIYWP